MIPFLRRANALPLLLAFLLLPGSRAALRAADDDAAARKAAAAELLQSMHLDQTVASAGKRMLTGMETMADRLDKLPNLTPEKTKDIQRFRDDIRAMVEQQLGWDQVKPDVIQAYADEFTESELKELNTFYRSPTGQKFLEKQQTFAIKLNQVMQQKSMAIAPSIRQKIQAINQEVRPMPTPGPAAAPVKVPAAGPGAPPAPMMIPAPVAPIVPAPTPVPAPAATPAP